MSTFDPEEWVEVAELCCDRIEGLSGEALLRTALNRAYYAALLCVKRRIEQAHGEGSIPRFQTHAAILATLRTGGRAFTGIRDGLRSLQTFRERADYELRSTPLIWGVVHSQVRMSRELIRTRIKSLPDAEFRRLVISSN
ncbi:MAG: HEPN domain-containing protein [Longimicrobiaceae bacterium]